jgi:hypothetical protein
MTNLNTSKLMRQSKRAEMKIISSDSHFDWWCWNIIKSREEENIYKVKGSCTFERAMNSSRKIEKKNTCWPKTSLLWNEGIYIFNEEEFLISLPYKQDFGTKPTLVNLTLSLTFTQSILLSSGTQHPLWHQYSRIRVLLFTILAHDIYET